jgi:toxin YoeB
MKLAVETMRDPFNGTGRPERLRHKYRGNWSRRLTDEHRITYVVTNDYVEFLAARHHYDE